MAARAKQTRPQTADPALAWSLARRSAEGDRAAFEQIYRLHCDRIYGLCLRLCADAVEAEILMQDTFVKAWFAMAGYRGQGPLGGWLARMAVNLWRDGLRSRKRALRLHEEFAQERAHAAEADDGSAGSGSGSAGAGAEVVPLLTGVDLERAIARLPAGARAVFVLYDVEGYTHREIAGLLDVATGTVKAQVHRARVLLRAMLQEKGATRHGS